MNYLMSKIYLFCVYILSDSYFIKNNISQLPGRRGIKNYEAVRSIANAEGICKIDMQRKSCSIARTRTIKL